MNGNKLISLLAEYLVEKGYPSEAVKQNYECDNNIFCDVAIVNQNEIFEIYQILELHPLTTKGFIYVNLDTSNILIFSVTLDKTGNFQFEQKNNKIKTFRSFYSLLEKYVSDDKDYSYFFRGHSNIKYVLKPSVYRKENKIKGIEEEDKLFKEAIRRTPQDFPTSLSTFEKLVKMQHYGLPTRLLDLTSNPLIALYFAVSSSINEDGEIYIFKEKNDEIKFYDSDAVSVVSNIARRPISFNNPNINDWKKYNKSEPISYLLHEIKYEKPQFLNVINRNDLEKVFCVLPKLDNPRIIKQSGAFYLFGIDKKKSQPAKLHQVPRRIIINKQGKSAIEKELKLFGIDKSTLFPEIEHILEIIKVK